MILRARPRQPLVTVVTPTLQRASLLERTLASVRAQTYPRVEHIVVDGGSTDGTLEMLERYAGTYELRWVSEPDRGMYDAVNKGLRLARGEILAYLNSDDAYFPWSVETFVETLSSYPEADIAYGDALRFDRIAGRVVPVFQGPVDATLATIGSLIQPATAFRRTVWTEVGGFDDALRYVADLDFWLRAKKRFIFHRVDEFLAVEERHEGMLSVAAHGAMAAEDRRVRSRHTPPIARSSPARLAARAWLHARLTVQWLRFVLSTRGVGSGWRQTRATLKPRVPSSVACAGVVPSHGGWRRSAVLWAVELEALAGGTAAEPEATVGPKPQP